MALKNEFDDKSFRIVLTRTLIGALIGALPGTIHIVVAGQNLANHPFGMILLQTGSLVGALAFGLAALAGTITSTLKNRGAGPKSNRLKEYLQPETLPPIPPSTKVANKGAELTEIKQSVLNASQEGATSGTPAAAVSAPATVVEKPEQRPFEDFDQ